MLKRRLFPAVLCLPLFALSTFASAQFRVEISGVGTVQVPVAVARFRDEDKATQQLSAIIRADLERSGLFRNIDAPNVLDESAQPAHRRHDASQRRAGGRRTSSYGIWKNRGSHWN